jgi:hypothetical protein
MGRLCERPGCSEQAAVAYGMRIEDLVFWLDVLHESTEAPGGVLCQRHGDSMVVPRDWTLDDLRDPDLHLFRPPRPAVVGRRRPRRRNAASSEAAQQLEFGELLSARSDTSGLGGTNGSSAAPGVGETSAPVDPMNSDEPDDGVESDPADRWTPRFDAEDDLDGLLSAQSPLLSRAFRGTDRTG